MAFQIIPPARPGQKRTITLERLRASGISIDKYPVLLLGVRGYYLDTMGERGANDRKIYDDAIFLVSNELHLSYNANCDPAAFRKSIASLMPGIWRYRLGIHGLSKPKARQYTAFVQAAPVTVARDEWANTQTGFFGINIHRGSRFSTSSLGCQTIWPGQWKEFINAGDHELKAARQTIIPYVLIEEQSR